MSESEQIDLSEFLEGIASTKRCTLCALIPKLPDERKQRLELALTTVRVSGERIYRVINDGWGYGIGLATVRRHRKEHMASE